jgi:predicted O-linked N-acetylglucosamine transferase (SPINDLY family)
MLCNWKETERIGVRLKQMLASEDAAIEPFTLLAYNIAPAEHLRAVRQYVRHRMPALVPFAPVAREPRAGKIKVAYLSSAFQRHPTGWQIGELIELHDRSRFEVLGISYGPDDGSEIRARLERAFDQFCDVTARSDREVAQLLRDAVVDIAVDLKGFTEQARPAILAYRPAPVQASYFGYVGTMGVDFIDYILADRIVLPPEQQESYSEKIVYLPDSYWVNDSKRIVPDETPSRRSLGLPENGFVFCSFNNSYKITAAVFDIWMRLLREVDGSVLWLLQTSEAATRNLREEARARDVDPERLIFAPKTEISLHLARHRAADLFLDNLPVNAHTAASDALWVGLPVVSCIGDAFIGRVAASLLAAVGLPELVTHSLDEYHALALNLATDRRLLDEMRGKLMRDRDSSRLFDTKRLCRHVEQAYETMLEIFRRGEPVRSFEVTPFQAD